MNKAAKKLSAEARKLFRKEDYDSASLLYDRAIEEAPNIVALYSNRSLTHYRMGLENLALEDAEKVIELDPQNARGYYRRASAYVAKYEYEQAIEDFEAALKLRPSNKQIQTKISRCHELLEEEHQSALKREALPDEMIAKILCHVIRGSENRHAQFIKLRSVCYKWYAVTESNKNMFRAELVTTIRTSMEVREILARMAELPLVKMLADFFKPFKFIFDSCPKGLDDYDLYSYHAEIEKWRTDEVLHKFGIIFCYLRLNELGESEFYQDNVKLPRSFVETTIALYDLIQAGLYKTIDAYNTPAYKNVNVDNLLLELTDIIGIDDCYCSD